MRTAPFGSKLRSGFAGFLIVLFLTLPAWAIDRTVAVSLDEPLEISLPPPDALAEWMVQDAPAALIEQVSIRRLPAETVFVFRPLQVGTGLVRFFQKVVGASGGQARTVTQEVEVMVTDRKIPPPSTSQAPSVRGSSGRPRVAPGGSRRSQSIYGDPLIMKMLDGHLGFPAKNPVPPPLSDTDLRDKRNPLPYSLSYIFPKGSYLLNPTHQMPLPDTPPGLDTAPPAYHQALTLARRGLYREASGVLEELIKDLEKKEIRNPAVEAFYQFVVGHLRMADGKYKEAVDEFKKLHSNRIYSIGSRFYSALAMERSGDTLGAITGYQSVVSLHPDGVLTPESAYRIARLFLNAKVFPQAMKEYTEYIETYPQTAFIDDAIVDLAKIYDQVYEFQNFETAMKLYDSVIQNLSESPHLDTAVNRKNFIQKNYF